MAPKKEKKSSPKSAEQKRDEEKPLRRTSRNIRARNDDDFLIGQQEIDRCIGRQPSQDEVGGKRTRKYNYYDDCSDYEQNHRHPKKKPLTNNSVEGLLEWKEQQIIVPTPTDDNSKIIKVKSICKQQLDKHIQNIEALFINIDWGKKNQGINDFKNLKIDSFKLMEKGLIFIWAPKELIFEILEIMQEKQFFYVENLEIVHLDRQKAISLSKTCKGIKLQEQASFTKLKSEKKKSKEQKITNCDHQENQHIDLKTIVAGLDNIDPNQLILSNESQYFSSSKRTLLIFRRKSDQKIELRHQRTCDVVFDMPQNPQAKCPLDTRKYIYGMIQTMLPKCLQVEDELKMLELWGDSDSRRRGWATMIEL